MASKKVSVSSTSLSMTLPISCQICLGKVREPVVCPNQHVFCSTCMDTWLRSHSFCPTCRTSITTEQPCKKILGSIDLPVNSDAVTRAELRRTRLDLIRREYEDELKSLQNTVERLKSENKQLHEKMIERERTMASMDFNTRSRGPEDGPGKLDIDMLVKLTTRLQEASHTYESLRGDMDKIKEDNKKLLEENKNLLRENTRLKEDPKFSKSPQRYSHYTMAGLQTKVGQYEREVQQLRRALVRSDNYIDDLSSKLEVATGQPLPKTTRPRNSPATCSSSCTITSLASEKDAVECVTNSDLQETEKSDLPEAANLPNDNKKKRLAATSDSENQTPRGHSPLLAPANGERLSFERGVALGDERESGLSSRRSSEVSLYGQDLDIPPGPLTSSLNILEPVEGEAIDRPPSRGELLLLGDRSSRRAEKPPLEENLDMFTASRQLILLSERRSRHRDGIESLKMRDLSECSPSSSDGGKRKLLETKSIDFDVLVNAAGDDSASNSTSRESPPNFSRDELDDRASPEIRTFSLAKIKSEIGIGQENEIAPKKARLESGDYGNDSDSVEQRDS